MNLSTNEITVIGIDHGYGNIKTAHSCFKTGVAVYDKEPTFKNNLLIYDGKYYIIGEEHKEFKSDKMADEDYYVLTLAAIARELRRERITEANVFIAAGLPLTWVSEQKQNLCDSSHCGRFASDLGWRAEGRIQEISASKQICRFQFSQC